MSVLANDRNVSSLEYQRAFSRAVAYCRETIIIGAAKRKHKWIVTPIENQIGVIHTLIAQANIYNDMHDVNSFNTVIQHIAEAILDLQSPLWEYWNIAEVEIRKMVHTVNLFNHVIDVLPVAADILPSSRLLVLDRKAIEKARFIKQLAELHDYIHSKIVNSPCKYDSTLGAPLSYACGQAFVCAIYGNSIWPQSRDEYITRSEYMRAAFSYLKLVETKSASYFCMVKYSERVMREWSNKIVACERSLKRVMDSDVKRFGSLL